MVSSGSVRGEALCNDAKAADSGGRKAVLASTRPWSAAETASPAPSATLYRSDLRTPGPFEHLVASPARSAARPGTPHV